MKQDIELFLLLEVCRRGKGALKFFKEIFFAAVGDTVAVGTAQRQLLDGVHGYVVVL